MAPDLSSGLVLRPRGGRVCASFDKTRPWYLHACVWESGRPSLPGLAQEQVATDVAYLCRILMGARARRVVDLGCGYGTQAMGLAKAGFNVTAVDVCAKAVEDARERAARQGIIAEWRVIDPTSADDWPFREVDAVICTHALHWGSGALQRRLLRGIRRNLAEGGLLILEWFPSWMDWSCFSGCNSEREFCRSLESKFDLATGSAKGQVTVCEDGRQRSLPYEFRQYSLVEALSLLRAAGFAAQPVDTEASTDPTATAGSTKRVIAARRLPSPPATLAVTEWGGQSAAQLDLRYAPDEAELLDPSPADLWQQTIEATVRHGAELVSNYPVYDPYGGERGAEIVGKYFGCALSSEQVTFAAGVTALLYCLSDLADGGPIAAPELVHGDLEAWAVNRGVEVSLVRDDDIAILCAALEAGQFPLLHLDRPTFTGRFVTLGDLEKLVRFASTLGTIVLIDESAAPYPGPAQSAARLVNQVNNLVVLRGFTKAYSWGGLRAGLAVASPELASRIREQVPPMQVGELALQAALRLLLAGDVFSRLRARIHAVKPAAAQLLARSGFKVIEGHPSFPWIAVDNERGSAEQRFERCGIRCLRPASPPMVTRPPRFVRITIPLSDERIALFNRLLSPDQPDKTDLNSTKCFAVSNGGRPEQRG